MKNYAWFRYSLLLLRHYVFYRSALGTRYRVQFELVSRRIVCFSAFVLASAWPVTRRLDFIPCSTFRVFASAFAIRLFFTCLNTYAEK